MLTRIIIPLVLSITMTSCGGGSSSGSSDTTLMAALGAKLFADTNLSFNRSQSCATCHDPGHAFVDPRNNEVGAAVSLGDDGKSLGDRNAPTVTYAQLIPVFQINGNGNATGGQFVDGRAADLADQASRPPIRDIEMGMPDKASVVVRIMENSDYVAEFQTLFGSDIFNDTEKAYASMAESIASFEMTPEFVSFDSKYDRSLTGEYTMTEQEFLGMSLFFSPQATSCSRCHQLKRQPSAPKEPFTNYNYRNIGVPVNERVRAANGNDTNFVDHGLLENPVINDTAQDGKFKIPTLRNVAVTGPYMHNGVFSDLKTVVQFYDRFNNSTRTINPETGLPWAEPEVASTVATAILQQGQALNDNQVDAIIAFLKTLTDQRYEQLIKE